MKKLILLLSILFCISLVSAFDFDNVKNTNGVSSFGYPNIELKNLWGFGSTIATLELEKNTDYCLINCFAETEITLNNEGVLIDDVKFITVPDNELIELNNRFYLQIGSHEIEVNDYEHQCSPIVAENGTEIETCSSVLIGSHTEEIPDWVQYNLGDILPAGTYRIKLEGIKNPKSTVDWQIKSQGIWIDDWAIWYSTLGNGLIHYYSFENSYIDSISWLNFTPSGTPDFVNGKKNLMINFTQPAYALSVSNWDLVGNSNRTVNFWGQINIITPADIELFFGMGNALGKQWELGEYNGEWYIGAGGAGYFITSPGSSDTNMHMQTMSWNGTAIIYYRDGTLINYVNTPAAINTLTSKLSLAYIYDTTSYLSDVSIDEMAWWNRSLTQTEVNDLYNSGAGLFYGVGNVILQTPTDNYMSPIINVAFNCSAATSTTTIVNISLWTNATGTWARNQTLVSGGVSNSSNFTAPIIELTKWNCEMCDSDNLCVFAPANRTVNSDIGMPVVSVFPNSYNYHLKNTNLTFSWSANDTNIGTCWYDYSGTNVTVVCSANQTQINTTTYADRDLFFYANNTAGNLKTTLHTWNYKVFEESIVYNRTTAETATENYYSVFNTTLPISFISLIYNGTSSPATVSGNTSTASKTIPLSVGEKQFAWNFTMSDGSIFNSYLRNQTFNRMNLTNCTTKPSHLNFSILDETLLTKMNASISNVWTYYLGDGSVNKTFMFSDLQDNKTTFGFCFTPVDKTVKINGITEYYSAGYDHRTYIFSGESFTNTTTIIPLYLLSTASSDVVTFTVVDDYYTPLNGVLIKIYRWDITTDTYYLVNSITTGADGTAGSNLVLNDAYYLFYLYYNGKLILSTSPEKVIAITKLLQVFLTQTQDVYNNFNGVSSSLIYDNTTQIITFIYNDANSKIQGACLNVQKLDVLISTTLTQNCSSSISSIRTFDISSYGNGTFYATGVASYSNNTSPIYKNLNSLYINVGLDEKFLVIGKAGQVISLIFIGTMAMIGIASGSIPFGLILIIASFIALNLVGFANFTQSFVVSMISIIIMIAISLERRIG